MIPPDSPDPRPPNRRAEAGYSMVVLMVAVTILMVLVAAALPVWTQVMKREKEAELISRGWQYAEAIRVFQQRHGRYPTRLEELLEVEPRSIRKLWEDPMTESGEWGLVFQGGVAPPGGEGEQGRELAGARGPGGAREDERRDRQRRPGDLRTPEAGEQRTVGPIVGVRSLSDEESIRVLFGEQSYAAWLFTVNKFTRGIVEGGKVRVGLDRTEGMPVPARWIGRPFPPGLQPEVGAPPGGEPQSLDSQGRPRRAPPGR